MTRSLFLSSLLLAFGLFADAQTVRFETNAGNIDVTLLPASAPRTVQNFLNYMNKGAYANSFFHRSVRSGIYVIQGGGYRLDGTTHRQIDQDAAVVNEFRVSNTRGTIAMAKLGGDPNSATNQFFFNTSNNANQLNTNNGGFTVFGRVANDDSLAVMDKIQALPIVNGSTTNDNFAEIPLQNYTSGSFLNENNLVVVKAIRLVEPEPAISSGGVVTAGAFGGFAAVATGSWLEIYGSLLAPSTREWAGGDFSGNIAPTSLDGVSVTVDSKPASVRFISPGQVNVQVPAGIAASGTVSVVVTNNGKSTAATPISVRATAGGLLAPPIFRLNDRQFVAAIHAAGGAFVTNGFISDLPKAPAARGELLIFYGVGFGPVEGGEVAGQIAGGAWRVRNGLDFRFGDVPAQVDYAGLVPGFVGLYQFNVLVPAGAPLGDIPLKVTLGGEALAQTLFISVE
ncbi:MAG: peptidylprolyl isomerase [Bryobacteraceae bacterium]|nr:peptidylprolyl isomerase [Bryobacteraceae bacterium]